jgi:hypothetical protein
MTQSTKPNQPATIREKREKFIRAFAVLAVLGMVAGMAIVHFPTNKSDVASAIDFSEFYCAAQIVRQGLGHDLYNAVTQAAFEYKVAALHVFFNHPPFETLVYLPFTYFSYRTAYILWVLVSLGLLAASTRLICKHTAVVQAVSQYVRMPADFGLVLALFATFSPVTTCLMLGQNSVLTFLIYTLVFVFLTRGSQFAAGCMLACGLYKFQLILPFLLILVLRRKWPAIKGFVLIASFLLLASVAISGVHVLVAYPYFLFFDPVFRKFAGFAPQFMPNLNGLVYLGAHTLNSKFVFAGTLTVCTVATLVLTAKHWSDQYLNLSFAASLLGTMLCSYHLYNYDLTLLLLPIAIVGGELAVRGQLLGSRMFTFLLIVLFIPPLHFSLALHETYGLMAVPILLLWVNSVELLAQLSARSAPRLRSEIAGVAG